MNTKTISTSVLLSLLLALLPLGMFSSCEALNSATPQEAAQLQKLDQDVAAQEAEVESLQKAVLDRLASIEHIVSAVSSSTPGEDLTDLQSQYAVQVSGLMGDLDRLSKASSKLLSTGQEAADLEGTIAARNTGALQGLLGAVDPKLGVLAGVFAPLVSRLGFRRSRIQLVRATKQAVRLQGIEAFKSLARAYGLSHSGNSVEEVLDRTLEVARREETTTPHVDPRVVFDLEKIKERLESAS